MLCFIVFITTMSIVIVVYYKRDIIISLTIIVIKVNKKLFIIIVNLLLLMLIIIILIDSSEKCLIHTKLASMRNLISKLFELSTLTTIHSYCTHGMTTDHISKFKSKIKTSSLKEERKGRVSILHLIILR